nr:lytic transglycosylase F [Desulfuromonadales bacterium]
MMGNKAKLIIGAIAAVTLAGLGLSIVLLTGNDQESPPVAGQGEPATEAAAVVAQTEESAASDEAAAPATEEPAAPLDEPPEVLAHALEPWLGDLDGMADRGFIRVLTAYNPIFFTYDGAERKGLAVDVSREFEAHLTKRLKKKQGEIHVVLIPVARDDLIPYLLEGRGDIVAANLTITPARKEQVAFSDPTYPDVAELVITGPGAPEIGSLDDLAASVIHIRKSSSYFEHLTALNDQREAAGQTPIPIVEADELLEDYDLLEMVNAGLIPAVIVDSHKAALWAQVFDKIKVHEDLAVHSGGSIAWAMRPDNPKLLEAVNTFVKDAKKGTLLGNILIKRYLQNTDWVDDVRSGEAEKKYEATIDLIKKYAGEYDFDWLMIVAQGYQESKLDQNKKSDAGAIGVMQVLPSTAADPNVGIPGIEQMEPNIHAGVKYLRFLKERY